MPGIARFFEGLVRRSFSDLQVSDPVVVEHVVDLLVRFARTDALYRIREPHGKRLETVVELLMEAPGATVGAEGLPRERDVRQHIGDYTLFMSGVFRAYVERHGFLGLYLQEGERAYRETARLERQLFRPAAGHFEALAAQFERMSGGLDYMTKVYFHSAARQSPHQELLKRFTLWN